MAEVKRKRAIVAIKMLGNESSKKSRIAEKISDEIAYLLDLPIETFEIILKELNLKEIGNIALTCEGLKQKIETVFKNKCKFYQSY